MAIAIPCAKQSRRKIGPVMSAYLSHRRIVILMGFLIVVSGELLSRFVLDLGNPPLYLADPQIEYMLRPDQNVMRFGNQIKVNHWGMRSADFPQNKTNPEEIRILVIGDSVVNGGNEIGHEKLATVLLQNSLQATIGVPVTVGNVSAGSWGPGNWLAYIQRYGFFNADLVILLVNSGDYTDNPTYEPLDSNHPDTRPLLALEEVLFRYLPRYLPNFTDQTDNQPTGADPTEVSRGMSDLSHFLGLAKARGKVMIFFTPTRWSF
jgi:hypothetical protein